MPCFRHFTILTLECNDIDILDHYFRLLATTVTHKMVHFVTFPPVYQFWTNRECYFYESPNRPLKPPNPSPYHSPSSLNSLR